MRSLLIYIFFLIHSIHFSNSSFKVRPTEGKYVPPPKRKNGNAGKIMRSTPPPPSPGSANSKNVYTQPPPPTAVGVNVAQPTNIPVGIQTTHNQVQHPVPINMAMPPSGVVVTYNTPPPFVPSPTTQNLPSVAAVQGKCKTNLSNSLLS